jgi:hypothetical protein
MMILSDDNGSMFIERGNPMASSRKLAVVCSVGSMFAMMAAPPTHADEKKPALDAEAEKSVRQAVYNYPPAVSPIPQKDPRTGIELPPITILVLPEPLAKLYKQHPRRVLELLLRIMDGADPKQSSLAAGYALELMGPPGRGLVCIELFDKNTYDVIEKNWKTTPRQHWIKRVQDCMAKMKVTS